MKTAIFGDYIKTILPKTKIQAKAFLDEGKFPIVSQEARSINGFWNNVDDLIRVKNPVIIFGDHTRVIKYIDFDFVPGADGTKILSPPDEMNARYLYYWLLANPIKSLGYSRHFRILKDYEITIPSPEGQRRVVERLDAAFEKIDRAVDLTEKNDSNQVALQSSYLFESFSDSSNVTVKIGDVCDFKPSKSNARTLLSDNDEVTFAPMEQLSINKKYFTGSQTKKLVEVYSSYVYFQNNDVIYAKITPCFENGKMGLANNLKNGIGFGSSEFVPIRCGSSILPEYLYYFLLKPDFIAKGRENMRGASGHKRVPDDFVKNMDIPLPSLEEQRRMVERLDAAFEKNDQANSLREAKLKRLHDLKKSMLQQAFSGYRVQ